MSVASWDHAAGTSTSSILNTTEPSGLEMTVRRFSHTIWSRGFWPGWVQRRGTRRPKRVGASAALLTGIADVGTSSVWLTTDLLVVFTSTLLIALTATFPDRQTRPTLRGNREHPPGSARVDNIATAVRVIWKVLTACV